MMINGRIVNDVCDKLEDFVFNYLTDLNDPDDFDNAMHLIILNLNKRHLDNMERRLNKCTKK